MIHEGSIVLFSLTAALALLAGCASVQATDLEQAIEAVIAEYPEATVAVSVRDPERGVELDLRGDRVFHAASTMKTPVAIEVYRQAEAGHLDLDGEIPVENHFRSIVDGSEYSIETDSDDAIYERLGEVMTVRELVYNMITVSSNLATNILIEQVTADSVQQTVERLGGEHMQVLRGVEDLKAFEEGLNNVATSSDLARIHASLMEGEAVSPASDRAIVDIHLEQQFDSMIPAGLPEDVSVAHKTGSITNIHHDAGIVFPEGRSPYVLVILTEGIGERDRSAALGAAIAEVVHTHLRP